MLPGCNSAIENATQGIRFQRLRSELGIAIRVSAERRTGTPLVVVTLRGERATAWLRHRQVGPSSSRGTPCPSLRTARVRVRHHSVVEARITWRADYQAWLRMKNNQERRVGARATNRTASHSQGIHTSVQRTLPGHELLLRYQMRLRRRLAAGDGSGLRQPGQRRRTSRGQPLSIANSQNISAWYRTPATGTSPAPLP